MRRCRPLLGTFVEISASGLPATALQAAVDAAFSAVEKVHRLMSVHDPESELSLLNREAALRAVSVSPETFEVLRRAAALATESNGAFDHSIAPMLARWALLPAHLKRRHAGNWRDVQLLPGDKVRFLRPLALDLGGIAKGFAVDRAIESLCQNKVTDAIVNAGGDLRVLGDKPSTIHLRHPANPRSLMETVTVEQAALATSSPCFTERKWHGQRVSHLVNTNGNGAITGNVSVSVRARECWLADALTKVVLNAPERAESLLAKYDAEAYVFAA